MTFKSKCGILYKMANPKHIVKSVYVAPEEDWSDVLWEFEDLLNNPPEGFEVNSYFYSPETEQDYATWQVIYKEKPIAVTMEEVTMEHDSNYRKFKIGDE